MKEYARVIVTTTFHIMPAVSTEGSDSISFARAKDLQEHCWLYLKPAQIGSNTTAIEPVDTRDGHLGPASPLDVRKATFDDMGKVASTNGETLDFEPSTTERIGTRLSGKNHARTPNASRQSP